MYGESQEDRRLVWDENWESWNRIIKKEIGNIDDEVKIMITENILQVEEIMKRIQIIGSSEIMEVATDPNDWVIRRKKEREA